MSSKNKLPFQRSDLPRYSSVLVIYTGGTIGMIRNENNELVPKPNEFYERIRSFPQLHDATHDDLPANTLLLPFVQDQLNRIRYRILEYDPLLDSSNMGVPEWVRIAQDIHDAHDHFQGFVVLHGTDTLAYTASALSFMLEGLKHPVIITGSQIPIFETRTDGRDNLVSALILVGNYDIPEVCVFFNAQLFRGNRTIKVNCDSFEAFGSPNLAPLATMGVNVEINEGLVRRAASGEPFGVQSKMDERVGLLRLFPTISGDLVRATLEKLNGVVLMTYGAGNIPSNKEDFIGALREASERGVLILNVTQCSGGSVSQMYETSHHLRELGVISGHDMTAEAALGKLSYVLGKEDWDLEMKRRMLQRNLRGEMTENE
ncbi:l-asparaginase i [Culex quinquefasciatus]|uniref:asparaginase n=1 Tax=Culex quinquefasciatus TaxID=7176 RepID=B0WNG8_CULQU|nr:l-asparaginase i [Culex quinquefasciatus]|eukprot:XP_001850252.1 l-asparaginase i [Culex quinquefasciatus]